MSTVIMLQRFTLVEVTCFNDLKTFIENHSLQDLDDVDEAVSNLDKCESIVAKFNECHTELRLALGEGYRAAYECRDDITANARKYVRDLITRGKELKKLARLQAADKEASERLHASEMERQLQQAARDRLQAA